MREIGKLLNVSHTTIENHIRRLVLVKKLDIWVPHELNEIHPTQRINIGDTHFKRNAMKNGSSTITLIEKDHGPSMMNQHKLYQKLS